MTPMKKCFKTSLFQHFLPIPPLIEETRVFPKTPPPLTWTIVCIGYQPPLSFQAPLKLANCPSPPFLGNPPSILVFREPLPSLKVGFFSEPQKYESFSSLIPSYLLKVTKFLGKSSQFEFLVMTEEKSLSAWSSYHEISSRTSFLYHVVYQ